MPVLVQEWLKGKKDRMSSGWLQNATATAFKKPINHRIAGLDHPESGLRPTPRPSE
jgi:hypothetical protein